MSNPRIEALQRMAQKAPRDPRYAFGLAAEYEKLEDWDAVVAQLERYLEASEDEGNAYGRLARALIRLGREDDAREAYRQGIAAARAHGHPTMAAEFADELADLDAGE